MNIEIFSHEFPDFTVEDDFGPTAKLEFKYSNNGLYAIRINPGTEQTNYPLYLTPNDLRALAKWILLTIKDETDAENQ